MHSLARLRIGSKIYCIVGLMSAIALLVGWIGFDAMRAYDKQVSAISAASQRAVVGERVNGLVLGVVMDSRGIYMSRDAKEVDKFAPPLLKNLDRMRAAMAEWKTSLPPDRHGELDAANRDVEKFIEFRTELVRLGRTVGNPTAREYGDNDANRAVRQSLNKELEQLAESNNKEIATRKLELSSYYNGKILTLMLATGLGILASIALSVFVVVGSISRPITALRRTMRALAGGDKTIDIPFTGRRDEIGQMADAVQIFKDTALDADRLAAEREQHRIEQEASQAALVQAEEKARRKRKAEREQHRVAEEQQRLAQETERESQRSAEQARIAKLGTLMRHFDERVSAMLQSVASAANQMQGTAASMASTAEATRKRTTAVATATDQASTNVQTVATAADELTASIGEIGRQVVQSTEIADKAVREAGKTNETVKSLAGAAQRIGQVVDLINSIAGQTNLLALNATIEAARAGAAGKGFAVVASEVKNLADQTAKATGEIGQQIAGMQTAANETVTAIQAIGATIGEINQIATAIASAIKQQGAATEEIARSVRQAAAGADEAATNIDALTGAAGETGTAAGLVLNAAGELSRQSDELKSEVDRFLVAVKAA